MTGMDLPTRTGAFTFLGSCMNTFILLFVLAGSPNAQLGTYNSLADCQDAIRQIFMANIYVGSRNNPAVIEAVNTSMKYQQEYVCVPTGKAK